MDQLSRSSSSSNLSSSSSSSNSHSTSLTSSSPPPAKQSRSEGAIRVRDGDDSSSEWDQISNRTNSSMMTPRKSEKIAVPSPSPSRDPLSMSKTMEELKQAQRSLALAVEMLEKKEGKKRKKQNRRDFFISNSVNSNEKSCQSTPTLIMSPTPSSRQCTSTSTITPPSSPPLTSDGLVYTQRDHDLLLRRKFEIVATELSRSRMEHAKLAKKVRKGGAVREQLIIEIPDFPMEFYDVAKKHESNNLEIKNWFQSFNDCSEIKNCKDYTTWINNRVTNNLPAVINIMCNVWKPSYPVLYQLNGADLLRCRQVSKSWKYTVDKVLEEVSVAQVFDDSCDDDKTKTDINVSTNISLKDEDDSNKFFCLALRSDLPGNPFPSRSLVVKACHIDDIVTATNFKKGMDQLLKLHGNHLHSFTYISCLGDNYDQLEFFSRSSASPNAWKSVMNWLRKMPNLKTLKVMLPHARGTVVTKTKVNQFKIQCGFPQLPKLSRLELRYVPSCLMLVAATLNHQVQDVSIVPISGDMIIEYPVIFERFKNLSELSLNVLKIPQVSIIQTANWNLKKLSIYSSKKSCFIDLDSLFETVKKFEATLTDLRLKVKVKYPPDAVLTLELPQLQNLSIILQTEIKETSVLSYDFLLPLLQLENLKIGIQEEKNHDQQTNNEIIQLRSYIDRLYESNIWGIFPCLKNIVFISFGKNGPVSSKMHKYTRK